MHKIVGKPDKFPYNEDDSNINLGWSTIVDPPTYNCENTLLIGLEQHIKIILINYCS